MAQLRIKASQRGSRPAPAVTSREVLAAQVAAFVHDGGRIQQVARGVSGQGQTVSRHISLGHR